MYFLFTRYLLYLKSSNARWAGKNVFTPLDDPWKCGNTQKVGWNCPRPDFFLQINYFDISFLIIFIEIDALISIFKTKFVDQLSFEIWSKFGFCILKLFTETILHRKPINSIGQIWRNNLSISLYVNIYLPNFPNKYPALNCFPGQNIFVIFE